MVTVVVQQALDELVELDSDDDEIKVVAELEEEPLLVELDEPLVLVELDEPPLVDSPFVLEPEAVDE